MGEYEGVPEVLEESMMSYTSEPALEAAEAVENVRVYFLHCIHILILLILFRLLQRIGALRKKTVGKACWAKDKTQQVGLPKNFLEGGG